MNHSKPPLYEEYSAHFARGKEFRPELQYSIYQDIYGIRLKGFEDNAVLDLGCGKGEWLSWLRQQGHRNLTGVDLSNDLQYAPEGIELIQEDVLDFLHRDGPNFDLIHAKDLIEHFNVDEAMEFCQLARQRLRLGGQLWLLTFNAQAPFASATHYSDLTHRLGLTPDSACQLLRASGFEEVAFKGVHPCPFTLKGRLRKFLYRPVQWISSTLIVLRHGSREAFADCNPDLFISGRRPETEPDH